MSGSYSNHRRQQRGIAVIRAMERELWRQANTGKSVSTGSVDLDGTIMVHGRIDLPMLAWVTEQALLREVYGAIETDVSKRLRELVEAAE